MDYEGVASQAREMAAAKNRSYEANAEELERKFGRNFGSVSLTNDIPSLQVVTVDEQLQAAVVHVVRLGERERLPNEA